jgi:hypothetical protein
MGLSAKSAAQARLAGAGQGTQPDGLRLCHIPGKYRVLVSDHVVYAAGNGSIEAIDLTIVRQKRRIGPDDAKWTTPHQARVYCMAMAGETLLTGNRDSVDTFQASDFRIYSQRAQAGEPIDIGGIEP